MSRFEPGDTVIQAGAFPAVMGVVCRILADDEIQAFFAEGPHMDSFSCDVYPPEWLTRVNDQQHDKP